MADMKYVVETDEAIASIERLRAAIETISQALDALGSNHGGISIKIAGQVVLCDVKPAQDQA